MNILFVIIFILTNLLVAFISFVFAKKMLWKQIKSQYHVDEYVKIIYSENPNTTFYDQEIEEKFEQIVSDYRKYNKP